jgi:hypothetical protein
MTHENHLTAPNLNCVIQHVPLVDAVDFAPSVDITGVNLGSEQSTVHKFLIIFAFGEEADEAHCCTNVERLDADSS